MKTAQRVESHGRSLSPSVQAVRWTARIWAVLSIALLAAFAAGSGSSTWPTSQEWIGLLLFPGTVAVGLALGWRFEAAGGALSLVGLAGFYLWHWSVDGSWPHGPYFAVFTAPAVAFLVSHFLAGRQERTSAVN